MASLAGAGRSCKCKPTATTAPANIVGWWGGDGNPQDISGSSNHGTLNGTEFDIGKVGQSFKFDGVDDNITFAAPPTTATDNWTMEAWINPANLSQLGIVMSNGFDNGGTGNGYSFGVGDGSGGPGNKLQGLLSGIAFLDSGYTFPAANQWYHVAMARSGGTIRFYVNGVQTPNTSGSAPATPTEFRIGSQNGLRFFNGRIDEPSVYNQGLTIAEIQSIYNAGLAGKLKRVSTVFNPISENSTAKEENLGSSGPVILVGDATVFFLGNSTTPGFTQWMPVSLAKLPPLPTHSIGLTYDLSTTWQYTGITSVCFNLPSFTAGQFASLRIYHLESDNWVNRTNLSSNYPNLCTNSLTSLSPFAIANLNPNAAEATVGGRVMTASGQGVSRAKVYLTDSDGVTRTSLTSSLGYFSFGNVLAGQTYVIVIGHKRYTFAPRVVSVEEDITELEFVAIE